MRTPITSHVIQALVRCYLMEHRDSYIKNCSGSSQDLVQEPYEWFPLMKRGYSLVDVSGMSAIQRWKRRPSTSMSVHSDCRGPELGRSGWSPRGLTFGRTGNFWVERPWEPRESRPMVHFSERATILPSPKGPELILPLYSVFHAFSTMPFSKVYCFHLDN